MSRAACKVVIDGGALQTIGNLGTRVPELGEFLEQPGPRKEIEAISKHCQSLGELTSAWLLEQRKS